MKAFSKFKLYINIFIFIYDYGTSVINARLSTIEENKAQSLNIKNIKGRIFLASKGAYIYMKCKCCFSVRLSVSVSALCSTALLKSSKSSQEES